MDRWLGPLLTLTGLAVLAGVVLGIPEVREAAGHAVGGETDEMRDQLRDLGVGGALVLVTVILAHAVVFYPAEIVNAVAGYVYGFWGGLAIVHAAWMASAFLGHSLGRWLGRPVLVRIFGEHRMAAAERWVERGGWQTQMAARLIPIVPFGLFNAVAGAARVPLGRFTWTTLIGYLPITALAVLFGSRLHDLSWTDPLLWLAVAASVVLVTLSYLITKRAQTQGREREAERAKVEA